MRKDPQAVNFFIDPDQFDIRLPRMKDILTTIADISATGAQPWMWSDDVREAFTHVKLSP